jgi:protein-disulfide isomerase
MARTEPTAPFAGAPGLGRTRPAWSRRSAGAALGAILLAAVGAGYGSATPEAPSAEPQAQAQPAAPSAPPAPQAKAPELTDKTAGKGIDLSKIAHSPADGSPYLGPREALVVVNVFSDFQCPVCKRAADPLKQVVVDFPDRVKVVFRHNALDAHQRARAAALSALAAGRQGRFWEYHDRLFANTGALDDASLERSASDLGLDLDQWRRDIADPASLERITRESRAAFRLGVPGTPGIFINGHRDRGWGSYEGLKLMVAREIEAGEKLLAAGTPLAEVPAARIRERAERNARGDGEAAPDVEEWIRVLVSD